MSAKLDRYDAASFLAWVVAVAATVALYGQLPAQVPIHFNMEGHANGWASREVGGWLLPGVALLTWALLRLVPRALPTEWEERMTASPMSVAALALVLLMALLQLVVLFAALHRDHVEGWVLWAPVGGYTAVLGQLMPRIRRNPFIGIRTAFTLSSDENWLRTHRFAGFSMTIGGLAALAFGFVSPAASVAAILIGALAPVVYSYVVARHLPSQG
jgi:uncharacterized membrane protein